MSGLRASNEDSAAAQLACEMSELSEEYWCAGWLSGCEFELWRMVQDFTVRNWGMGAVADDQIDSLRALSEKCGGWVAWFGEGKDSGERFVPMAGWLEMYAKHEAELAEWHKARMKGAS